MLAGEADSITILRAPGGRQIGTKRFVRCPSGEVRKFGEPTIKHWHCSTEPVNNIRQLSACLFALEKDPNALVIRGEPDARRDPSLVVRRNKQTFAEVPRRWAMFDVDKLPVPAACDLIGDPAGVAAYVVGLFPPAFRDVPYHWQLSTSAGLADDGSYDPARLSLHLWFWFDRPIGEAEWKERASAINDAAGFRLVDPATFRTVQPHFTAAPVFDGLADPLPRRSGFHQGLEDEVCLAPLKPRQVASYNGQSFGGSGGGFEGHLARLGDGPGLGGFNGPLTSAVASYVATRGTEGTDREALKALLRSAIAEAPRAPDRSQDEIDRYCSDAYLDESIASATAKFGHKRAEWESDWTTEAARCAALLKVGSGAVADAAPSSGEVIEHTLRKGLLPGVVPAFASQSLDAQEGKARMDRAIQEWLDEAVLFARVTREREEAKQQARSAVLTDAGLFDVPDALSASAASALVASQFPNDENTKRQLSKALAKAVNASSSEVKKRHGITSSWKSRQPPRLVLKATAGSGKSSVVRRRIALQHEIARRAAAGHMPYVDVYVSTIKLAEEWAQRMQEALDAELGPRTLGNFIPRPSVKVVYGRGQINAATGKTWCARSPVAERVAQKGLPVFSSLCRSSCLTTMVETRCPLFEECNRSEYLSQYRTNRDAAPTIRIYTHEHLTLPRTMNYPVGDLIVVDESCLGTLVRKPVVISVDDLREAPDLALARNAVGDETDLRMFAAKVAAAMTSSEPKAALRAAGITKAELSAAAKTERKWLPFGSPVGPMMSDADIQRQLATMKPNDGGKRASLYEALAGEIELERSVFHGVENRQGEIYVHQMQQLKLGKNGSAKPVLILDADADLEIERRIWGEVRFIAVDIKRQAKVTQHFDSRCSNASIVEFDTDNARTANTKRNKRKAIADLVAAEAAKGRTLVISTKKIRAALTGVTADEIAGPSQWQGATISHYGAIRGKDVWKDCDRAIIIGRDQPPVDAVEAIARAVWATDLEPLIFIQPDASGAVQYPEMPRGYSMQSEVRAGVLVPVHPDPRCQRILELQRERESVQAIDRLRLVYRDPAMPGEIIILCSLPLPITVDRLVGTPTKFERAVMEMVDTDAGLMPLSGGWLAKRFPLLFGLDNKGKAVKEPAKAAKKAVERADSFGPLCLLILTLGVGGQKATYRVEGGKGRFSQRCLVLRPERGAEALKAELEGLLDAKVLAFDLHHDEPVPERPALPPPPLHPSSGSMEAFYKESGGALIRRRMKVPTKRHGAGWRWTWTTHWQVIPLSYPGIRYPRVSYEAELGKRLALSRRGNRRRPRPPLGTPQ